MAIDFSILITDEWLPRPPGSLAHMLGVTYEVDENGIIVLDMGRDNFRDPDTGKPDRDAFAAHWVNEYMIHRSENNREVSDEERARVEEFFGKMADWMKRKDATTVRLQMWW